MLILLLLFSWKRLISHQHQEYSHRQWNQLILRQCLKRMIGLIKATMGLSIIILPNLSNAFEKSIYNQLPVFFDKVFSKISVQIQKRFQCSALSYKIIRTGALLTDLPNRFNCLSHELLVAKLSVYRIEDFAVTFISDYLINRNQRTKIGNNYSS